MFTSWLNFAKPTSQLFIYFGVTPINRAPDSKKKLLLFRGYSWLCVWGHSKPCSGNHVMLGIKSKPLRSKIYKFELCPLNCFPNPPESLTWTIPTVLRAYPNSVLREHSCSWWAQWSDRVLGLKLELGAGKTGTFSLSWLPQSLCTSVLSSSCQELSPLKSCFSGDSSQSLLSNPFITSPLPVNRSPFQGTAPLEAGVEVDSIAAAGLLQLKEL